MMSSLCSSAPLLLLLLLSTQSPTSVIAFSANTMKTSFVAKASLHTMKMSDRMSEFDHILGEGTASSSSSSSYAQRRQSLLRVPDTSSAVSSSTRNEKKVTMVSSMGMSASPLDLDQDDDVYDLDAEDMSTDYATTTEGGVSTAVEPSSFSDSRLNQYMEQKTSPRKFQIPSMKEYIKGKDFSVILVTVMIPSFLVYLATKKVFTVASSKVDEKSDFLLDSYAAEMVYHDGNFDEMKACHSDYKTKLAYLGPVRNDAMIKRFLELYAKKKIVSPQAISSMSYVFSIYKLSEEKAAKTLVDVCLSMPEKIASAGKLLFIGSRMLKTNEAKKALDPIKTMLSSSYRDDVSGPSIVDMAQQAMGEAAYRETVNAAGKRQSSLTPGWEILGLTKEVATTIFEEAKKEKFVSSREAHYGSQSTRYDEKGRALGKDGKPQNPEERAAAEKEERDAIENGSEGGGDMVKECSQCGYTIAIAAGRESKFFGPGFKCPNCGADKDQFSTPEIPDDADKLL